MKVYKIVMQGKTSRPEPQILEDRETLDEYDFGQPQLHSIRFTDKLTLSFREPTATDLGKIEDFMKATEKEVDMLIKTICLLHEPDPGRPKLTLKNAQKIHGDQLKSIAKTLAPMLNLSGSKPEGGEELDNKSEDSSES